MAMPAARGNMVAAAVQAALLLSVSAGAAAQVKPPRPAYSNDHVGWGFEKYGGFPPNPWHSWQMNLSTTAYFVGNASGMDSPAELAGEVKLGYVGIGWQLDNIPSHYSNLEKYEILEAQRLQQGATDRGFRGLT